MHAVRANYQAAIWRRSLISKPWIQNPVDSTGWMLDEEGQLTINWMAGPMAPDAVLEFLSCKCIRKCELKSCQCMMNGLKCTEACKLQTCENMKEEDDVFGSDGSDSEDE